MIYNGKRKLEIIFLSIVTTLFLVGCSSQNSDLKPSISTQPATSESNVTESTSIVSQETNSIENPLTPEDIKECFANITPEEVDERSVDFYAKGAPYATDAQKKCGDSLDQLVYSISFNTKNSGEELYFNISAGLAETDAGTFYTGYLSTLQYEGNGIYTTKLTTYESEQQDFSITFVLEKIPGASIDEKINFTLINYEGHSEGTFMEDFANILNVQVEFMN